MNSNTNTSQNKHSIKTINQSLAPYAGDWTSLQVTHLLRRTMYGANRSQISESISMGLNNTVDRLLADIAPAEPPLNSGDLTDTLVPVGTTWVNAGRSVSSNGKRRGSLRAWTIGRSLSQEFHIREKMTLFWHNHFVVSDTGSANAQYMYINLLRTNALGNIRQLAKDITVDPSMLRYLNGSENVKGSPNENFARELLELFTIGKGPLIGPGDYTHYTEYDIQEMAKILTGWRDVGYGTVEFNDIHSFFRVNQHSPGDKQLSSKFNNAIISDEGENEYKTLIDIIFQQDEVSRFMCRNIYQWFVHFNITEDIETNIIEPLAQILRDNDYNVKPVMEALLRSEHFFEEEVIGCMIKNPLDYVASSISQFNTDIPVVLKGQYRTWLNIYNYVAANQLSYFYHPSVAGWKAYYQGPGYYHIWLNSATLPLRQSFTDLLAIGIDSSDARFGIDVLKFASETPNAADIDQLILAYEALVFCKPLSETQRNTLREIVLQGLPAFEWTIEYTDYINHPDDDNKKMSIENKLKLLTLSVLRMPEYQMS